MILVFCLDDHGGMTFGGKRQSRDRGLVDHLMKHLAGRPLWCAPGSAALFEGYAVRIDEAGPIKAGAGEAVFCETALPDLADPGVEALWVYRWHRSYPCDGVITLPACWHRQASEVFAGTSHETVEWEEYVR